MNLPVRIVRILQSLAQPTVDEFCSFFAQPKQNIETLLDEWEKKHNVKAWTAKKTLYPQQLVDDLALFNLQPPVQLEQVKKARNLALKQFHPDKFQQEPKKIQIAEQISTIYNTAYTRITSHYRQP